MNIIPHSTNLPVATVVNPATEGLRRDNNQREIISQVGATNPSAAEKGVASDKERARSPSQANETFDFANLKKQAEEIVTEISDQRQQQGNQQEGRPDQESRQGEASTHEHDYSEEQAHQEQINANITSELKLRDKEVRTHELAHATTGGALTGAPSYSFEIGPDGKKYAVEGEVSIDLSTVPGDPRATIAKMKKVHAAALAPASPSAQDIRVAANASQKILQAQSELLFLKEGENSQPQSADKASITNRETLAQKSENQHSDDFDTLINQTLSAQEAVISRPTTQVKPQESTEKLQSAEVLQRAGRIEDFYFSISQGYEKPDNYQFELTA